MRKANRAAAGAAAWQVVRNTDSDMSVWQRAGAVPRMIGAKVRGRYPELSSGKLLGMLVLAAYILSPVDFVPELFVPLLGLADDVAVAVWLTTMALGESERFVLWERQNQAQQAFHEANQPGGHDHGMRGGQAEPERGHGVSGHDGHRSSTDGARP
ncbi:YkvA family protein [Nocardiopsis dassonvillei]|uniref:YkvA family protein n=1 Tax=Nocardiopsis dassonvillei TaxID=2014 RepID=UPI0034107D8A